MRAVDDPKLLPYLPLIYVAWSDADLTNDEIDELRRDGDIPDALLGWLDPNAPPSEEELTSMRKLLRGGMIEEPEEALRLGGRLGLGDPLRAMMGREAVERARPAPTFDVA